MSYSYTEKRRIRKNFGRLPKVMRLPKLIETQLNSYAEFLQSDVPADKRNKQGLEEVFQTLFPITSVSGNAALEYVSYELGNPAYTVQECLIWNKCSVKLNSFPKMKGFVNSKNKAPNSSG